MFSTKQFHVRFHHVRNPDAKEVAKLAKHAGKNPVGQIDGMTVCRISAGGQVWLLGVAFQLCGDSFNRAQGRKYALESAMKVVKGMKRWKADRTEIWTGYWNTIKAARKLSRDRLMEQQAMDFLDSLHGNGNELRGCCERMGVEVIDLTSSRTPIQDLIDHENGKEMIDQGTIRPRRRDGLRWKTTL